MTTNSFEEAIEKANNIENNRDIIIAITGSISSIMYGFRSIPKEWIDPLSTKGYLFDVSDNYCNCLFNSFKNN